MSENKNSENQNYLSGFDSVEQTTPKKPENTFNPTPMFSGLKPQNEAATQPAPKAEPQAPVTPSAPAVVPTPAVAPQPEVKTVAAPTQEEKSESIINAPKTEPASIINEPTVSAEKPVAPKTETPGFIPNGTYSYSANKVNNTPTPPINNVNTAPFTPRAQTYTPPTTPTYQKPITSNNQNPNPQKQDKEEKPKKYGVGVVLLATILAAIIGAGGGVFGVFFSQKYFNNSSKTPSTETVSSNSNTQSDTPQNVTNIQVDETVNSSVEAVAKKAGPSIVGIRTTAAVTNFFGGSSEATGEGSGIIYTSDGYIITNYHVIESAVESNQSKVEVFLTNDTETAIGASIVGYNKSSDLAVVKVEKTGLPAIEFADSDKLKVGQYAVAIGNPGGLEFIGSVSYGVISGLNRSVAVGTGNAMSLIQTDAAINPGNSGGALVDITGKLIGVNSIKLVSTGYEGMGFAIPSNTVKEIIDNIIDKQYEPTPYIGIEISQNYTADQLVAFGYPAGAVVISVAPGSPAEESQIQRGDIITEFNGAVISNYQELENAILACKPGDSVSVKIFRAGRFYSSHINVGANNAQ